MGYKKNDKCIQKAFDDERLFVLMTRDATAPRIVIEWIKENLDKQPEQKLREAFECALEMQRRGPEIRERKMFDGSHLNPYINDEIGLTRQPADQNHLDEDITFSLNDGDIAQNPQSESEG